MEGKGGKTWEKGNHTSRHTGLRVVKVPSILSKRKIKKAKSNACFEGSLEEKAGGSGRELSVPRHGAWH